MTTLPSIRTDFSSKQSHRRGLFSLRAIGHVSCVLVGVMAFALAGCQSPPVLGPEVAPAPAPAKAKSKGKAPVIGPASTAPALPPAAATPPAPAASKSANSTVDDFILQSGDSIRIAFPAAPNLDTTQAIRSDGRITLPMLGEVVVSGKSPTAFEKELAIQYAPQLVSKEVNVTVVSAPFYVFLSGSVSRSGKITSDRTLSVLEAIMEAGGFDAAKANLSAISIIRQIGGTTKQFTVNLKDVLQGRQIETFYLRRGDIVHVPEKFTWF